MFGDYLEFQQLQKKWFLTFIDDHTEIEEKSEERFS